MQITPEVSGIASDSAGLAITSANVGVISEDTGADRFVVVAPGENLGTIAKREYGDVLRYVEIFEANRDVISDPNNVAPGTRLRLP